MSNKKPIDFKLILLAIIATFLWGSAFPAVKIGFNYFNIANTNIGSQMLFAGIRFLLAGLFVLIIGSIAKKNIFIPGLYKPSNPNQPTDIIPLSKIWKSILLLALTQTLLQYTCYYIGLANVTGTRGSIFNSLSTILSVTLGMIYFKSRFTKNKIIGILTGIIGVTYLCFFSGVGGNVSLLGDGMLLFSACFSALGSIINKKTAQNLDPFFLAGSHLFIGGFCLTIIGLVLKGSFAFNGPISIALLLYLVFISAVAFSIWSYLLAKYPIEKVGVFQFLIPIFGALLSCIFLGEELNIATIISLVLVSIGIIFVQK